MPARTSDVIEQLKFALFRARGGCFLNFGTFVRSIKPPLGIFSYVFRNDFPSTGFENVGSQKIIFSADISARFYKLNDI